MIRFGFLLIFVVGLTVLAGQVFGQVLKLTDPAAFSETAVFLEFEESPTRVAVSSFYRDAGVRFSAQKGGIPTAVLVPLDNIINGKRDGAVQNSAAEGASAESDLLIQFDYPVRRAAVTLSNGGEATVATLSAFSPDGRHLGSIQQDSIDPLQGPFVGIETADPEGISLLVVSFGDSELDERINDLRFDFLTPRPFVAYVPQMAAGTAGDLKLDLLLQVHSTTGGDSHISVSFKGGTGIPMELDVDGQTMSSLEFRLPGPKPLARSFRIDGGNSLKVGYAIIEANLPVEAQATYIVHRNGEFASEASVTSTPARVAPMLALERDPMAGLDMGIAAMNPGDNELRVVITIITQELTDASQSLFVLGPGEQRSFFLSEDFEELGDKFLGRAFIQAEGLIAVTGLRTRHGLLVSSLSATGTQR